MSIVFGGALAGASLATVIVGAGVTATLVGSPAYASTSHPSLVCQPGGTCGAPQYFENYSYDYSIGQYLYISAPFDAQTGELIGECVVGIVGGAILTVMSDGISEVWYSGSAGAWISANCGISIFVTSIWNWGNSFFVTKSLSMSNSNSLMPPNDLASREPFTKTLI